MRLERTGRRRRARRRDLQAETGPDQARLTDRATGADAERLAPAAQAVLRLQRTVGNAATGAALRVQRDLGDAEALAAVDTLPADVLRGGGAVPLGTEAEKREFLRAGREYFSTHEAAIAHFSGIERCGIPGAPLMHRDAKQRLEAVAASLGGSMPSTTVGFAFRGHFTAKTHYTPSSMHTFGYAIDYDATNMPRIGRGETAELIRTVTGAESSAQLGEYGGRRGLIRGMGEETAQATPSDPRAAQLLNQVQSEADRLAHTSQDLQGSLGAGRDTFLQLRTRYFEAQTPVERAAVLAEVPPVLAPWTGALDGVEQNVRNQATAASLDPAALPTQPQMRARLERLATARRGAERLRGSLHGTDPRAGAPAWRQIQTWETQLGLTPAADATADARLEQVVQTAEARRVAEEPLVGARERLDRIASLRRLLADPGFLFGSARTSRGQRPTTAAVVDTPSMAQLLERGFFNPGDPHSGSGQFGAQFMVEMARHGFDLGAAWGGESTDSMHFELVAPRPGGG